MTIRDKHIVLVDLDDTMTEDYIDEEKLDYKDGKKDPDTKKTDKFSHIQWVTLEEVVYTYFTAMKKISGVPLSYVIRNTPTPSRICIDRKQ